MDRRKTFDELLRLDELRHSARNNFIQEILMKLDEMTKQQQHINDELDQAQYLNKSYQQDLRRLREENETFRRQMTFNPFVLVLIDGDDALFLDKFLRDGKAGGEDAARELMKSIQDYLRGIEDLPATYQIVIKVYAKQSGLGNTYVNAGILGILDQYRSFVAGFNSVYQLCEYIDAGTDKEAADSSIKKNLDLFSGNVHCKHMMLAFSGDNSYVGSLRPFDHEDWYHRITLVEALPFTFDLRKLSTRFRTKSFDRVFRDSKIVSGSKEPLVMRPSITQSSNPTSFASIASQEAKRSNSLNNGESRRNTAGTPDTTSTANPSDNRRKVEICWNKSGCRIDRPLGSYDTEIFRQLRGKKLCNRHFITKCTEPYCTYGHDGKLSPGQLQVLKHVARLTACFDMYCEDPLCTSSHRCIHGPKCPHKETCKFPKEMHHTDTVVSEKEIFDID